MLACLLSHTHASSKGHYLLPLPSGSVAKCSNANMHWNQGHVLYLKRGIEKNSSRFASRAKQTGRKERLQDVRIHLHSKYKILHGKHQRILKEAKLPINVLKQCLGKRKGYPLRSGLFFLLFFFLLLPFYLAEVCFWWQWKFPAVSSATICMKKRAIKEHISFIPGNFPNPWWAAGEKETLWIWVSRWWRRIWWVLHQCTCLHKSLFEYICIESIILSVNKSFLLLKICIF